jgi:hypothetical protein
MCRRLIKDPARRLKSAIYSHSPLGHRIQFYISQRRYGAEDWLSRYFGIWLEKENSPPRAPKKTSKKENHPILNMIPSVYSVFSVVKNLFAAACRKTNDFVYR